MTRQTRPPRPPAGTRSVERALRLLVELSRRGNGWRLTDLARHCDLDVATTHRLLGVLAHYGLAIRRDEDRHFLAGPELLNLGLAAGYHVAFVEQAGLLVRDLAAATRLTAFVYLRTGADFVCIAREGGSDLLGLTIHVGTRRPLVTSAGGVAMLIELPAAERQRLVAENLGRLAGAGELRQRAVRRMVQRSLAAGYGLNPGDVVPEITALSAAAALPAPWQLGSVTVSGRADRIPPATFERLARRLRAAAARLAAAAADDRPGGGR